MDHVGRSCRGYLVSSGPTDDGQCGWRCECGAYGVTGNDDQDAALAASYHARHCGHPRSVRRGA